METFKFVNVVKSIFIIGNPGLGEQDIYIISVKLVIRGKFEKGISGNINTYPTAFPYGNGMVLHFYQQQESSTTKTVHKVINKGLKAYV